MKCNVNILNYVLLDYETTCLIINIGIMKWNENLIMFSVGSCVSVGSCFCWKLCFLLEVVCFLLKVGQMTKHIFHWIEWIEWIAGLNWSRFSFELNLI